MMTLLLTGGFATSVAAQNAITADDFESGNTLAWDDRVGITLLTPDAYRYTQLVLRDPHLFITLPVFGCFDFTDNDFPLGAGPSANSQIATALSSDGDLDGFLDLSPILLFRPFDEAASGFRLDQGTGACTAPVAGTTCDLDGVTVPQTTSYDGLAVGTCLSTLPGTTSGYVPPTPEPVGPCFVSAARSSTLSFLGTPVPLVDVQIAAETVDPSILGPAAPTDFESGLIRGFLSEATANLILLPPDLPLVGGLPLSVLLPGGVNNCAIGDDRDTHLGESGWWFYFEFSAEDVPYTGP